MKELTITIPVKSFKKFDNPYDSKAIENTTRMKNWRRNVFMCMKEYGVMRRVGKIQIIHSIGQRVNFAKGVDNICMNILI